MLFRVESHSNSTAHTCFDFESKENLELPFCSRKYRETCRVPFRSQRVDMKYFLANACLLKKICDFPVTILSWLESIFARFVSLWTCWMKTTTAHALFKLRCTTIYTQHPHLYKLLFFPASVCIIVDVNVVTRVTIYNNHLWKNVSSKK